jgi:hypothetical protein
MYQTQAGAAKETEVFSKGAFKKNFQNYALQVFP